MEQRGYRVRDVAPGAGLSRRMSFAGKAGTSRSMKSFVPPAWYPQSVAEPSGIRTEDSAAGSLGRAQNKPISKPARPKGIAMALAPARHVVAHLNAAADAGAEDLLPNRLRCAFFHCPPVSKRTSRRRLSEALLAFVPAIPGPFQRRLMARSGRWSLRLSADA
jgi:hypothetical protein